MSARKEQILQQLRAVLGPDLNVPLTKGVATHGPLNIGADNLLLEEQIVRSPEDIKGNLPGHRVWTTTSIEPIAERLAETLPGDSPVTRQQMQTVFANLPPQAKAALNRAIAAGRI
jgi:hypothetical protein